MLNMTPEESDARLRRIHEEWQRWCKAHPTGGFRIADAEPQEDAADAGPGSADEAAP
jgi:hypothetical protein